ncbi:hypothetical protein CFIMG_007222RA00001 [Ceratocystis fimbriata CBS 114723]|uniref:Ubiquitin-like protease family profile domain-containing protein n=1 Tax=Ceratocystis fimbriata CBS 114723 TaxID=1035309 RepID=A0A2C5X7X6_9PEZI|nr:hypothetical protein CFIMG_007222RA00001 [Ceratocystis fimbriata CBS 114723]
MLLNDMRTSRQTSLKLVSIEEAEACAQRTNAIDAHLIQLEELLQEANMSRLPGSLDHISNSRQLAEQVTHVRGVMRRIYHTLPLFLRQQQASGELTGTLVSQDERPLLDMVAAFLLGLPEVSRRFGLILSPYDKETVMNVGGDVRDLLDGKFPASFVKPEALASEESDEFVPAIPELHGAADSLQLRHSWNFAYRRNRSSSGNSSSSNGGDDSADERITVYSIDDEDHEHSTTNVENDSDCLVPDSQLLKCADFLPQKTLSILCPDETEDEDDETQKAFGNLTLSLSTSARDQITAAQEQLEREEAAKRVRVDRALRASGTLREARRPLFPEAAARKISKSIIEAMRSKLPTQIAQVFPVKAPDGTQLHPHDFGTLVKSQAWLNDAIIDSTLAAIDRFANIHSGATNYPRSSDRTVLVLGSFFFPNLVKNGGKRTERSLRLKGVTPENFLNLETVVIPVCQGSHWTLLVVQPLAKKFTHMDSLNPRGSPNMLATVQAWLRHLLGAAYVDTEWEKVNIPAPVQNNGYDCGVFTILNAISVVLGLQPTSVYEAVDMPEHRWHIAAMLVNGGFGGDFDVGGL